jgi:hypothetical protein
MQSGVPFMSASVSGMPQPHIPGAVFARSIAHMSMQSGVPSPSPSGDALMHGPPLPAAPAAPEAPEPAAAEPAFAPELPPAPAAATAPEPPGATAPAPPIGLAPPRPPIMAGMPAVVCASGPAPDSSLEHAVSDAALSRAARK